jgi:Na+/proline symporter
VVLLPVIALLLAVSIDFFTQILKNIRDAGEDRLHLIRRWTVIIISVCVFLAGIQFYLFQFKNVIFTGSNTWPIFPGKKNHSSFSLQLSPCFSR